MKGEDIAKRLIHVEVSKPQQAGPYLNRHRIRKAECGRDPSKDVNQRVPNREKTPKLHRGRSQSVFERRCFKRYIPKKAAQPWHKSTLVDDSRRVLWNGGSVT